MIWVLFGAMAVATFLAVSQILVDADPETARRKIRFWSVIGWLAGLVLCIFAKPLFGLPLMALGAFGAFAAPKPKRASRIPEGEGHRRPTGRRANVEYDADAWPGEVGPEVAFSGVMTEEQAYEILGLEAGATAEEIARAHRSLMKKLHPDQGGATELAARVNAARDVLAKRRHD